MVLLQRLTGLFATPAEDNAAAGLYQSCVTQSRQPAFYQALSVPDTIDGRFDLLVLHVFLVMQRLGAGDKQQLFDLMFADMDRNLREMGVGDLGIGRRVKAMIGAFYGRAQAYEKALAADEKELEQVLARNIYGNAAVSPEALKKMAHYVRCTEAALQKESHAEILDGHVNFIDPVE